MLVGGITTVLAKLFNPLDEPGANSTVPGMVNLPVTNVTLWDLFASVQTSDSALVFTVPDAQRLILTDVVMTRNVNTTTNTFRANYAEARFKLSHVIHKPSSWTLR